jgi:hypothetical protein
MLGFSSIGRSLYAKNAITQIGMSARHSGLVC